MAALRHHGSCARARVDFSLRRATLLCIVTCQLWLAPSLSASALADGSTGAPPGSELAPEASAPAAGGPSESAPVMPSPPAGGGAGGPAPETPLQPPGGVSGEPPVEAQPTVVLRHRQKTSAPKKTFKKARRRHHTATHPRPATRTGRGSNGGAKTDKGGNDFNGGVKAPAGDVKTSESTGPIAANNVALPPQVAAAQVGALAAELAGSAGSARALAFYRIPLFLLPIYQAASVQYGVPWQILAAINEIETDYGSDLSVSSAGAEGWMQFEPSTWLQYGVDAVNAGYADPYNPIDAIFAAARYLRAAGAPTDLRAAILAYNHSSAYVESVLLRAKLISSWPKPVIATLTGLVDAGLPVSGKTLAWEMLAPAGARRVDLMSARNAAVLAVQDGRIVKLGRSRKLGYYVVLRDVHGDLFTYTGLGGIARDYIPPRASAAHSAPAGSRSGRSDRRPARPDRPLPLRIGSLVGKGTVLGHVHVPRGAKDGHLLFSIRPAGDPNTIDPGPILANWRQLHAALNPQGARRASDLIEATLAAAAGRRSHSARARRAAPTVAHSAGARRAALSPPVLGAGLTARQWDALIARIALYKGARAPTAARNHAE